jgi:hypothetical protein
MYLEPIPQPPPAQNSGFPLAGEYQESQVRPRHARPSTEFILSLSKDSGQAPAGILGWGFGMTCHYIPVPLIYPLTSGDQR